MKKKVIIVSVLAFVGLSAFTYSSLRNSPHEGEVLIDSPLHGKVMPLSEYRGSKEYSHYLRSIRGRFGKVARDCWSGKPATKGTLCDMAYEGTCEPKGCGSTE